MTTPLPFRWALRGALAHVAHVAPVPARAATGVVAEVYRAAEREFGLLAPPVALHSPAPGLTVACWALLRGSLLVPGDAARATREAVAAGVSLANACPYCVEVHGAVLGGLTGGPAGRSTVAALAAGRPAAIPDPGLRAVVRWAAGDAAAPVPHPAGTAELLAVACAFHYLNRMVTIYLPSSPLPAGLPSAARGVAATVLGRLLAPVAAAGPVPGAGPRPPAPPAGVPEDLAWVTGHPRLADTLARVAGAFEAAGEHVVPEAARAVVRAVLAEHAGGPPGPGPGWVDDATAGLAGTDRPAARLAMLTALAPYRVDGTVIAAFRGSAPDRRSDAAVLAATAWAAFTAARDRTARLAGGVGAGTGTAGEQP